MLRLAKTRRRPEPGGVGESPSDRSERAASGPSLRPPSILLRVVVPVGPAFGCYDATARGLPRAASMSWPDR